MFLSSLFLLFSFCCCCYVPYRLKWAPLLKRVTSKSCLRRERKVWFKGKISLGRCCVGRICTSMKRRKRMGCVYFLKNTCKCRNTYSWIPLQVRKWVLALRFLNPTWQLLYSLYEPEMLGNKWNSSPSPSPRML